MIVRAIYPYSEFDPNGDYVNDQRWTLLAYNWTDINHDGKLWKDKNHNGVVNHTDSTATNIDGDPLINFKKSGDREGRVRPVHLPADGQRRPPGHGPRPGQADGQRPVPRSPAPRAEPAHPGHPPQVPDRLLQERRLVVADHAEDREGLVHGQVPRPDRHPGRDVPGRRRREPERPRQRRAGLPSRCRPRSPRTSDGSIRGSLSFGGQKVADAQRNLTYDNGSIFGANDWSWRAESGDWRFFYFDVPSDVPDGTLFLSDTTWDDPAPYDRSRHADLRAVRERLPAAPAGHGRRLAVHPRHGRREREHQHRGRHLDVRDGHRRRRGGRHRTGLGGPPRRRPARHRLERRQVPRAVHDDRRDRHGGTVGGRRSPRRRTPARST